MLVCCCVFAGLTPRATLSLLNREQKSLISILQPAFRREPSYDGCNGAGTEARERGEKTAGAKADCRQIVRVVARRPQQWRDAHFNTVQLCEPPVSGGGWVRLLPAGRRRGGPTKDGLCRSSPTVARPPACPGRGIVVVQKRHRPDEALSRPSCPARAIVMPAWCDAPRGRRPEPFCHTERSAALPSAGCHYPEHRRAG